MLFLQQRMQTITILIKMRSIWRLVRFMPIIAVPSLWSGKYMLNDVDTIQLEQNLAGQQMNKPRFVDILSQEAKNKDDQTSSESKIAQQSNQNVPSFVQQSPTNVKASQQQKNTIQSVSEAESAADKNDPQQIVAGSQPLTSEQSSQKEQQQPTQDLDINKLLPNQVLVSSTCPDYLVRYLELSNFKLIKSSQISEVLVIKNSRNDIYRLEKPNLNAENDYYRKEIANFIRPPQEISTAQQAKQLLALLSNDSFVVMAYIPDHQIYQTHIKEQTKSVFDSYTLSRKVDIKHLEEQYVSYAYRSSSNKNNYIIARTPEAANFLKMETFNIGRPYLLHRSSKESGGDSSFKEAGVKYKVTQVQATKNDQHYINKLTHFYLNRIDNEVDMQNKIRQIQMAADKRKILVFYTQQTREEFHQKTEEILEKVARLQKEDVIVIKTSNENVLKKVLKVEPDSFATIRLIDLHSQQQPLIGQSAQSFFRRQKYKGPFRMENLCDFVSSKKWEEYYEVKKKVTSIKAVSSSELQQLNHSLVLIEKQGCEGCRYVGQSLEQLKRIIKGLNVGGRVRKQLIYRFKIQDPRGLFNLRLRRYSIFNDNESFSVPSTTPRLYYISQGKRVDLQVEKSLSKLNSIRKGQSPEQADDSVIADIIERIRQHQSQPSYQL